MNYTCFFGIIAVQLPDFRLVILLLYAIIAIPAVVLNSLVLYSIWKTPSLHKPSYILIASLAFSDLLYGSIGQQLLVITNIAALKDWGSTTFCYTWIGGRATSYWLTSVSLYTLAIISIDRLLAIRLKTRYPHVVTMKRVTVILLLGWVNFCIAVVVAAINFTIKKNIYIYLAVLGVCGFLVLSTITISYSLAYYYLRKVARSVAPNGNTPENSSTSTEKYRKSLNTMLLVFIILILFYCPHVCSAITAAYVYKKEKSHNEELLLLIYKMLTASELVGYLNSTANPLMYLWRMKDMRQAVRSVVRLILRRQPLGNNERNVH